MPRRASALVLVLAALACGRLPVRPTDEPDPIWIEAPAGDTSGAPADLTPLIRKLESSVVRLSVAGRGDSSRRIHASGFVISQLGYVITSEALIASGRDLRASFEGGRELAVEVVGQDPNTEIALLRIAPEVLAAEGISPLALGDSTSLRMGDAVITLGHGDSEGRSAAQGVVAGRDQRIAPLGRSGARYLRLDMLLVAGFGGAPLIDLRGRVVGMISGERIAGSDLDSISFAVPIEAAKSVLPDLARSGTAPTGWLGVAVTALPGELAAGLGLSDGVGALVSEVLKDSPAERAQIEQGDVILEFDGQRLRAFRDLSLQVARAQPGSEVPLVVLRRGARKQLRAVIESKLGPVSAGKRSEEKAHGWGLECEELTRELALRLSLPAASRGLVIARVEPGSAAQLADLQLGDVVLEVNGERPESLEELDAGLRATDAPILLVERGGRARFVELNR